MSYNDVITPESAHSIIDMRAQRLAADALDNFLIARGLEAQGEAEMAGKHYETVNRLNDALEAVLRVKDEYPRAEVAHEHHHQ